VWLKPLGGEVTRTTPIHQGSGPMRGRMQRPAINNSVEKKGLGKTVQWEGKKKGERTGEGPRTKFLEAWNGEKGPGNNL